MLSFVYKINPYVENHLYLFVSPRPQQGGGHGPLPPHGPRIRDGAHHLPGLPPRHGGLPPLHHAPEGGGAHAFLQTRRQFPGERALFLSCTMTIVLSEHYRL